MTNPLLSLAARTAQILPKSLKNSLYKLGPLTRLIRGTLNRAAPQGLHEVEIASGVLRGIRIKLDMQGEKDYWLGTYETDLQTALAEFVKPGLITFDIGANVGYISLLLGSLVGPEGQVFCFEALPGNVERLKANINLNPKLSSFTVIPKAVTDKKGDVEFLVHESDDMGKAAGSAGRDADYENTIKVPSISLDEFVYSENNPAPNLIKLDIEGGEVLALPGMTRLLKEARPLMLVELHGPESAQAVWEGLTAAGYTIRQMKTGYPEIRSAKELDWKAYLIGKPNDG